MMEESSDESAEIITKEEVATAEAEQTQSVLSPNVAGPSPGRPAHPAPLPALPAHPAPLPAFVTQSAGLSGQAQRPTEPQKTASPPATLRSIQSVSPQTVLAPGHVESPYEASSTINVPEMEVAPSSPQGPQTGLFGWFAGNKMISKVVEKTKNSMETMITTLDPGMREVIRSGGDICVTVTSTKESKVSAIREAFQQAFGRATVIGKESQATTAAQPVGFTAGLKGAQERLQNLRASGGAQDNQPIVSVEGFIVEMLPNRWYEISCLVLQDTEHRIDLQNFSQPSPIPAEYIVKAQDRTPSDYPLRWSGLAVTIGQVIEESNPHIGHSDWQNAVTGVSRRESLFLAAKSLAYMYKRRLPTTFVS